MKKKLFRRARNLGLSLLLLLTFQNLNAQQVTIGSSTGDPGGVPWDPYYGYSYAQCIYYASEINASGNITSVSYYFTGTSISNSNDLTIWMGNVSKSSFSSTTDWVAVSGLTQVFSGIVTNPGAPGWLTLTLTTPFAYNGTDNLIIAIDENASSYNTSSDGFYAGPLTGTNRSLYYRSDATNPDPNTPPTGTRTDNVPNIQINGLTAFSCLPPTALATANITPFTTDVNWTAASTPATLGYDWAVFPQGQGPSGVPVVSGTSLTTTANVTGLNSGTSYTIYVRGKCGVGSTSNWASLNFTTLCATITPPYTQDFSTYTPNCWEEQKGALGTASVLTVAGSAWLQDDWLNTVPNPNGFAARINLYTTGKVDWLVSPSFNLGASNNYALECDVAFVAYAGSSNLALGGDDTLALVISTDNGATWSLSNALQVWTAANTTIASGVVHVWMPLSTYSGIVKFGFYGSEGLVDDLPDVDVMVDNFKIAAIPLAIDLKSISAANANDRNRVDWATAKEDRGDAFEIERSLDGSNFTNIGVVEANGTASAYTFWDENPVKGMNYYRLKFVNVAGKVQYSSVVKAEVRSSDHFAIEAYPNPVTDRITVKTYGIGEGNDARISVSDITGKLISLVHVTGSQTSIDMTEFNKGIYFVKYMDGIHEKTMKISKQ